MKKVKQIMKLSIDVSDDEEDKQKNNNEFEPFKPPEDLEAELRTPKIETDDDFAAQVNAGIEQPLS